MTKRPDRIHATLDGNVRDLTARVPMDRLRREQIRERAARANRRVRNREKGLHGLQFRLPVVVAASVNYGTHREMVRPAYIDLRPEIHTAWTPDSYGVHGNGTVFYGDVILEVGTR